ncbi:MAG TPA: hypothetical protein VF729_05695 [Solirubrobacterales bacterium]
MERREHAARPVAGLLGLVVLALLFFATAAVAATPLRGAIDRSFGHNGRFFSRLGESLASSEFTSMLRQPDGKLVLTATVQTPYGGTRMVVQRRQPTGQLDPGFGEGGTTILPKAGSVKGLAIQADGRILVGVPPTDTLCRAVNSTVRRLAPNGAPDPSFGKQGVSAAVPFSVDRVAVDAEGRILVAGFAVSSHCIKGPAPRYELAVARLNADGTLDSGFGSDGVVHVGGEGEPGATRATGLVVGDDGRILVAGTRSLLRLSADGALDPSFGQGGIVETVDSPKALLALPGGEAVIAGSTSDAVWSCCAEPSDFVLSRHRPDGSLDADFGNDGRATLDVAEFDEASAVALSPDGGIVLAGGAVAADGCVAGDCAFTPILARFSSDGALDPDFGPGGRIVVEFPGGSPGYGYVPRIAGLAVAPSGQILAAGGAGRWSNGFVVAREPSGAPDPGFGDAGAIEEVRTLPSWSDPIGLAIGPGGKILVSASSDAGAHIRRGALVGLNADGSADLGFGPSGSFVPTEMWSPVAIDGRGRAYQIDRGVVARLDSRGQRDPLYGTEGTARLPRRFAVGAFLVRNDGTVLVVGRFATRQGMVAFRLTPRGLPDRGFGKNGVVEIGFGPTLAKALSVAVDRRGRIVLAGKVGLAAAVVRLLPDGRLDPRFARHGRRLNLPTGLTAGSDVALQADGKILVASSPGSLARSRFASLVRLRPDGALDRSFSRDGVRRVGRVARLLSLFVARRRILLATARGSFGDGYGADLRAYQLDGGIDPRFGRKGVASVPATVAGRTFRPVAAARQANGRIIVAGTARKIDGPGAAIALLRFR